ncbi:MAG: hypothetical protein R2713_11090 [Ilumatobacteraceae bacterium]
MSTMRTGCASGSRTRLFRERDAHRLRIRLTKVGQVTTGAALAAGQHVRAQRRQ